MIKQPLAGFHFSESVSLSAVEDGYEDPSGHDGHVLQKKSQGPMRNVVFTGASRSSSILRSLYERS